MSEEKQTPQQPRKKPGEDKKPSLWQRLGEGERKLVMRLSVILLLGLTLMYAAGLWGDSDSGGNDGALNAPREEEITLAASEDDLEAKLLRILSAIEGAGQVEVALSYRESGSAEYARNSDVSSSVSDETDRDKGAQSTSEQRSESSELAEINSQPVLVKESMPLLNGAVIVAEGARDAKICEQLYQAAHTLTGLPLHRIQVLPAQQK